MASATAIIVPSKFLVIIAQFFLTVTSIYSKDTNIYAGIQSKSKFADMDYDTANNIFLAGASIMMLFLLLEWIPLIIGISVYFDRLNICQIFLHCYGIIALIWFILNQMFYQNIWTICVITAFIPFVLEIVIWVNVKKAFRRTEPELVPQEE